MKFKYSITLNLFYFLAVILSHIKNPFIKQPFSILKSIQLTFRIKGFVVPIKYPFSKLEFYLRKSNCGSNTFK